MDGQDKPIMTDAGRAATECAACFSDGGSRATNTLLPRTPAGRPPARTNSVFVGFANAALSVEGYDRIAPVAASSA